MENRPEADYPAAHSMDTEWFAVDREGNVGFFETGEPGPVPHAAAQLDKIEVMKQIFLRMPEMLLKNLPAGHGGHVIDATSTDIWEDAPNDEEKYWFHLLGAIGVVSSNPEELRRLVEAAEPLPREALNDPELRPEVEHAGAEVRNDAGRLAPVVIRNMSYALYDRIHRADMCTGCVNLNDADGRWERLGFYFFDAGDEYHNGPYEAKGEPKVPLRQEALPEEIREQVMQCRFDMLSFQGLWWLQPLEHMPCATWGVGEGGTYLASDKKTEKPLPPDEEEEK